MDNVVCMCDWCVQTVKLSLLIPDPTLIKCAVKLTLFVKFSWKLVWMCINGSSPPVPHNKPYVFYAHLRYLSKHCCVQNFFGVVYVCRRFCLSPFWHGIVYIQYIRLTINYTDQSRSDDLSLSLGDDLKMCIHILNVFNNWLQHCRVSLEYM